jgi:hypothetical protein
MTASIKLGNILTARTRAGFTVGVVTVNALSSYFAADGRESSPSAEKIACNFKAQLRQS